LIFERYTAFFHLRAAGGQGIVFGVMLLNEYIARKHLGATRWQILALLLIPSAAQFMAVLWNPASGRGWIGKRPFRTLGIGLHAILFLPLLVGDRWSPAAFVALGATVMVAHFLLVPVQNTILARNYPEIRRGRRFGNAASVHSLLIVAVSVPVGLLLDWDASSWIWCFALAGLAAIYAYGQWGRLRRRRAEEAPAELEQHGSAWQVLRHDRTFLAFEGCFMLYGLGFLALQPVLPIYLVDDLGVSYTEVGLARGALFWSLMVVASPFVGWIGDRLGILRLAALGFLCLATFPLALWLFPDRFGLYLGFGLYGLAMAAVNVTWNLGPITMARGRDPIPYLNAHLALVGVRAVIGMTLATWIQQQHGSGAVFLGVVGIEIVAAGLMLWLALSTGRRWRLTPRG